MAIGMSLTKQASTTNLDTTTNSSNYSLGLDPFMFFITLSSVFNAVCYTGGKFQVSSICVIDDAYDVRMLLLL